MEQLSPIEEWADSNLAQDVEIRLSTDSTGSRVVASIAVAVISLILFVPPIWIGIVSITSGKGYSVTFSLVYIVTAAVLFAATILYVRRARKHIVRSMTQYGVVRRDGTLYLWGDLSKVEFLLKAYENRRYEAIEDAMREVLVEGTRSANCRLIFPEGFADVPPLAHNYSEILILVHSMPVQQVWKWA